MSPSYLLLNNKTYSYEQIRKMEYEVSSKFEETTLSFCSQWLNEPKVFNQATSGSTGKPKVIEITRDQMILSAAQTMDALELNQEDIALVCVDPAYIAGKMMLVRAFEHHLKIVIVEPTSNPLENLDSNFHFAAMVPMQIANVLQSKATKNKLKQSKAILIGGAPVNNSLANNISTLKCPVFETYGMTETVSHIALKRISSPVENHFSTLGDITLQTNDNEQLILKGAITNHKELVTNDIVKLISPTTFKWVGRIDNVINSGGVKIQLEEVEKSIEPLLSKLGLKQRFFIYKKQDEYLGEMIVLYIESTTINIDRKLKIILKKNLDKYCRPKEIIYLTKFIETASGKIDKHLTSRKAI